MRWVLADRVFAPNVKKRSLIATVFRARMSAARNAEPKCSEKDLVIMTSGGKNKQRRAVKQTSHSSTPIAGHTRPCLYAQTTSSADR